MAEFIYKKYVEMEAWTVLDDALKALVDNGDIDEKTDRKYIVGYLVKILSEKNIIKK